jgi:uncharacterized protein (TIGR02145 family)
MASSNYDKYGVLYNWEAASNACPTGWHLPTDEEWQQLEAFLGISEDELEGGSGRGTVEGDMLKSETGWFDNGNGNNESGFSALPGGMRYISAYSGKFTDVGEWGYFWSSTGDRTTHRWDRSLSYNSSLIGRYAYALAYGLSVRCVKD